MIEDNNNNINNENENDDSLNNKGKNSNDNDDDTNSSMDFLKRLLEEAKDLSYDDDEDDEDDDKEPPMKIIYSCTSIPLNLSNSSNSGFGGFNFSGFSSLFSSSSNQNQKEDEDVDVIGPFGFIWTFENKKRILNLHGYRVVKKKDKVTNSEAYIAVKPNTLSIIDIDDNDNDLDFVFNNVMQNMFLNKFFNL
jgi:hypothetical protein